VNVLFVSSEVFPLIKTGGLADVSGALPIALANLNVDIRILMPGYPAAMQQIKNLTELAKFDDLPNGVNARLLMGTLPKASHQLETSKTVDVMCIDCPALYARDGGPYSDHNHITYADNALRFGVLSKIAAILSSEASPLKDWQVDIVHCNDWQTGLTPAYLHFAIGKKAKSIMSLHNMAFQGCFNASWVEKLQLPAAGFVMDGFEYYQQLSFLKAGVYYADKLTTVSPTYAQEIQTAAFGSGFEGILSARTKDLVGILNGIDTAEWNPTTDTHLIKSYSAEKPAGKKQVKKALQKTLGLQVDAHAPLLGIVSRLTHQKGLDLLLTNIAKLIEAGCQFAILGSGEADLESEFKTISTLYPKQCSVTIGYNEPLSHQMMAGSDMFVMPSRFEPCGLNQLYGLAYGTLPIVNNTGGLADSIVDASDKNILLKRANGFVMQDLSSGGLYEAIMRAVNMYQVAPKDWAKLMKTGMNQHLSWEKSAYAYHALYQEMLA
jgi:starch synthase